MTYRVIFAEEAQRDLRRLSREVAARCLKGASKLRLDPRPRGCLKLHGSAEWRIRIGEYRIRYLIDDSIGEVVILRVRKREEAYRQG